MVMRTKKKETKNIGIIGTGFISKGFVFALENYKDLSISKILTRRVIQSCGDFPKKEVLTNSLDDLIENSDLVLECSGDVIHATEVIDKVLKAGKPIVTMNAEFHVTTGSYFVGKGIVSEAEGDQPGSLAVMHENITQMGFKPLVYGNVKGFYDPDPTEKDMRYWSKKQGISLAMVTASTDGTKLHYEQALVANKFGATIIKDGMLGLTTNDVESSAFDFLKHMNGSKQPISDYVINGKSSIRVFVVAEGDPRQKESMSYLKMGDGPNYFFHQDMILCHLEIIKTIRRILNGGDILLDNSKYPTISVAAFAKHDLHKGYKIDHPIGNFDIRGQAINIKRNQDHIPLGLLSDIVFKRDVKKGNMICWDDIEISDSLALKAWNNIVKELISKKL